MKYGFDFQRDSEKMFEDNGHIRAHRPATGADNPLGSSNSFPHQNP